MNKNKSDKSIFKFKQFYIKQNDKVFKVGTDGVLLGVLADIENNQDNENIIKNILDVGTGTGLIALICAQRNKTVNVLAIDSELEAFNLAQENFENSLFSDRLKVENIDFNIFNSELKFDYILSNPPYFQENQIIHTKHPIARHQLKLDFNSLIKKSVDLLSDNGKFAVIIPYLEEKNIISIAKNNSLFLKKIISIQGIKNGKIQRSFIEFSRQKIKIEDTENEILYIEESPRVRSEEYQKLTKDFYL